VWLAALVWAKIIGKLAKIIGKLFEKSLKKYHERYIISEENLKK